MIGWQYYSASLFHLARKHDLTHSVENTLDPLDPPPPPPPGFKRDRCSIRGRTGPLYGWGRAGWQVSGGCHPARRTTIKTRERRVWKEVSVTLDWAGDLSLPINTSVSESSTGNTVLYMRHRGSSQLWLCLCMYFVNFDQRVAFIDGWWFIREGFGRGRKRENAIHFASDWLWTDPCSKGSGFGEFDQIIPYYSGGGR